MPILDFLSEAVFSASNIYCKRNCFIYLKCAYSESLVGYLLNLNKLHLRWQYSSWRILNIITGELGASPSFDIEYNCFLVTYLMCISPVAFFFRKLENDDLVRLEQ